MKITLVYLPKTALDDKVFLRSFFANYSKLKGKSILVHDTHRDDLDKTAFLTKRISGQLSEYMTTNNAFSGHQRGLIRRIDGQLQLRFDLMADLLTHVACLALNTLTETPDGVVYTEPETLLPLFDLHFEVERTLVFPQNSLSPVAGKPNFILTEADLNKQLSLYPEESAALQLAYKLRPSAVCGANNFFEAGN